MAHTETAREDLAYVASAMRRESCSPGNPSIYFLWAVLVPIGFSLTDFVPQLTGAYWFVAGIGGGLASWWLGARDARRCGINDLALARRCGLHWIIAALGFLLAALPMATGVIEPANGASLFLLVGGLTYALAGIHLERGILPSGILMLAAYVALLLFHPPHLWTIAGIVIAISLAWSGFATLRAGSRQ
jgi:hypothetical protein